MNGRPTRIRQNRLCAGTGNGLAFGTGRRASPDNRCARACRCGGQAGVNEGPPATVPAGTEASPQAKGGANRAPRLVTVRRDGAFSSILRDPGGRRRLDLGPSPRNARRGGGCRRRPPGSRATCEGPASDSVTLNPGGRHVTAPTPLTLLRRGGVSVTSAQRRPGTPTPKGEQARAPGGRRQSRPGVRVRPWAASRGAPRVIQGCRRPPGSRKPVVLRERGRLGGEAPLMIRVCGMADTPARAGNAGGTGGDVPARDPHCHSSSRRAVRPGAKGGALKGVVPPAGDGRRRRHHGYATGRPYVRPSLDLSRRPLLCPAAGAFLVQGGRRD